MLVLNFCLLMLMATVTGVLCIGICMTGSAVDFTFPTMIEQKNMLHELGGLPGNGCMAVDTI